MIKGELNMKIDINEITAELQDYYSKMSAEELKIEYFKGASKIWRDIYDDETQKIMLQKILSLEKEK